MPSDETSRSPTNSVASVVDLGVTVNRTDDPPAIKYDDESAGDANVAVWAGTVLSVAVAWSRPPNVLRMPLSPGTAVIAAGVPPAGAPTCCGGPVSVNDFDCCAVPSMPG